MSDFVVDLELLTELIERMVACGARVEQVRDEVDARARRLHVTWQGAAATEHRQAHQRWVAGAEQMHEALHSLRSVAATANRNYSSAVRANQRMWAV